MRDSLEEIKEGDMIDWVLLALFGAALLLILLLCARPTQGYPVIITYPNQTQEAKQLIYNISEEHFKYVDVIDFTGNSNHYWGYFRVRWTNVHDCYDGHINMYTMKFKVLKHELGHFYYTCVLMNSDINETHADEFKLGVL